MGQRGKGQAGREGQAEKGRQERAGKEGRAEGKGRQRKAAVKGRTSNSCSIRSVKPTEASLASTAKGICNQLSRKISQSLLHGLSVVQQSHDTTWTAHGEQTVLDALHFVS